MCQGGWACKQGWRADSSKTVDKNTIREPSLGSTAERESLTGERKPFDHLGDVFCHWAETTSGFPGGASGKEHLCQCRRLKRLRFHPWVWKISWNRTRQPALGFLPVEFHGQRSLVGYGQTWLTWLSIHSRDYFIRSCIDLSKISLKIPLPPIPCASGSNHRISFFVFFFSVPRYQERKCERLGVGSLWSLLGKPSHNTLTDCKSCCYAVLTSTKSTPQKHTGLYRENTVAESRAQCQGDWVWAAIWHLLYMTLG